MARRLCSTVLSALLTLLPFQSQACVGGNVEYKIDFARGEDPESLVVTLTDPKKKDSTDFLDDIGFLSQYLGVVYLFKSAKNGKINLQENKDLVAFMKAREVLLRKSLKDYLKDYELKSVNEKLDAWEKILSSNHPVDASEFRDAFQAIPNALFELRVMPTAQFRDKGASKWSKPLDINKLQLPTYDLSRGDSCNSGISAMNTKIGGGAGSEKLPSSFTIPGGAGAKRGG